MPVIRFAATVAYDGKGFAGSQKQPKVRTVQAELETAAESLFGAVTRVDLAGRTDSGVHATGQVAAFTAETRLDADTVRKALNAHLPADVSVRTVRAAGEDFDPRRHAVRRWYRYIVLNTPSRMPLERGISWHVTGQVDVERMHDAAQSLVGEHDFRAFTGPLEEGRSSIRTVFQAGWSRQECRLVFDIQANAFLRRMVRRIVGALMQVGRGSMTKKEFVQQLQVAEGDTMGPSAPAHGLALQQVWYDERDRT